jgi:hypothetical protein
VVVGIGVVGQGGSGTDSQGGRGRRFCTIGLG